MEVHFWCKIFYRKVTAFRNIPHGRLKGHQGKRKKPDGATGGIGAVRGATVGDHWPIGMDSSMSTRINTVRYIQHVRQVITEAILIVNVIPILMSAI